MRTDPIFRSLYERCDLVFIDGMPIVVIARLSGYRVNPSHRLAVLDWIWPLLALAEERHWGVAHVGSKEPYLSSVRSQVARRHPSLALTLVPGFFDHSAGSRESAEVVSAVNTAAPHVLLVGMGMPLQERWLTAHLALLEVPVVITVGGVLGFLGGERRPAPRWLGALGLEWCYRLVTEPRRLARRYLVEPWALLPSLAVSLARSQTGRHEHPTA
ncbi:MAG: WecB/TagA/CpsF family glycosyltransferase [Acidimicrobiales bacterium]